MQDYSRTQELVTAAYNSEGSAQRQYEKTLDSLQSKLEKLKNAWHEFTMDIFDNNLIKTGIDAATTFLNLINKIFDNFGDFSGIFKLFAGGTFFKVGKGYASALVDALGEELGKKKGSEILEIVLNPKDFKNTLKEAYDKVKEKKPDLDVKNTFSVLSKSIPQLVIIVGLIGGIAKMIDRIQATNPVNQIKEINKQISNLEGTTSTIEQKIEDISSKRTQLNDYSNTLKDLQVGTSEWRKSLIEANSVILELISNYPDLAQYVQRNENGVLSISNEGFEEYIEDQQAITFSNNVAGMILKNQANEMAFRGSVDAANGMYDFTADDILKPVVGIGDFLIGSVLKLADFGLGTDWNQRWDDSISRAYDNLDKNTEFGGLNENELQNLFSEFSEAGITNVAEAMDYLYSHTEKYGGSLDDLVAMIRKTGDEFGNLVIEAGKYELAEKAQTDAIISSIAAQDSNISASDYYEEILSTAEAEFSNFQDRIDETTNFLETEYSERELRKIYADKIGGFYDAGSGKLYTDNSATEEIQLSEQGLAAALASNEIQEEILARMGEINTWLSSNKNKDNFNANKNLLFDQNKLTTSDLDVIEKALGRKIINSDDIKEYLDYINYEYTEEDIARIAKGLSEANGVVNDSRYITQLSQIFGSGAMSADLVNSWNSTLSTVDKYGDLDLFTALLKQIFAQASPEDFESVASALYTTDWSNASEVKKTLKVLKDFNIETDGLSQSFIDASGAIQKFNENLTASANSKEARDLLEGKEDTSTYTSEEAEKIANAIGKDLDEVFTRIDEDTYVPLINSVDELVKAVNENTAALIGENLKSAEDGQNLANNAQEALDDITDNYVKYHYRETGATIEKFEGLDYDELNNILGYDKETGEFTKHLGLPEIFGSNNSIIFEAIQGAMKDGLKLDFQGDNFLTQESLEKIRQLFYTPEYYGISDRRFLDKLDDLENKDLPIDKESLIELYKQGGDPNQIITDALNQIINDNTITDDQKRDSEMELVRANYQQQGGQGVLNTQTDLATEEDKEQFLQANIDTIEGLNVALENNTKELLKNGEMVATNDKLMKAFTIDNHKAAVQVDELNDSLSDNFETLTTAEKGSDDYNKALEAIWKEAQDVFGDNITKEFVEQNIDSFEALYEGGEGAQEVFEELARKAGEEYVNSLGWAKDETDALANAIAAMDGLGFDIYGNADMTEIFKQLYAVTRDAEATAKAIEALTGYQVTFEPTKDANGMVTGITSAVVHKVGAGGSRGSNYSPSGGSKSGGGSDKEDNWENPFDKLYNLLQDIDQTLHERNKIEHKYNQIIQAQGTTASDISANSRQMYENYATAYEQQLQRKVSREQEMRDTLSNYSDLSDYATFNWEDMTAEIDWDKINSVTDTELGDKIEEFVDEIERIQEEINDSEDELMDIEDLIHELSEKGRDDYFDFENTMLEALKKHYQDEIDEMSRINDNITNTNSKLIDSMQKELSKERQERQNQKTEQDIQDKKTQLEYLMNDTSGANQQKILELQKQIDEETQSYTDNLIDQKISELQDQNELAAEQREQQIDLAQRQLDTQVQSGMLWEEVQALMENSIDANGGIIWDSEGMKLIEDLKGVEGMSQEQTAKWREDTENTFTSGWAWMKEGKFFEETFGSFAAEISDSIVPQISSAISSGLNSLSGGGGGGSGGGGGYPISPSDEGNPSSNSSVDEERMNHLMKMATASPSQAPWLLWNAMSAIMGKDMYISAAYQKPIHALYKTLTGKDANQTMDWYLNRISAETGDDKWKKVKHTDSKVKFATGGLADFTGPAWLDGTPSKPEYILNAKQTEGFLKLIPMLDKITDDTQNVVSGDTNIDIDINVDKLEKDYDVQSLADSVMKIIAQQMRYRNGNQISNMR